MRYTVYLLCDYCYWSQEYLKHGCHSTKKVQIYLLSTEEVLNSTKVLKKVKTGKSPEKVQKF